MRLVLLLICLFIGNTGFSQVLVGRTTGKLSYLNYGLGEDRLGGAKMTYLDSNILVRVVDSVKGDYKVQLSKNHFAYLPKSNFRKDTVKLLSSYLTSSWRVWGDEKWDYVNISLPEKLPYKSIQEICPSKILVDVYGATSNTNWITQLQTVKEIQNVWYEQIEDDVFRIHIQLKHEQHWGYYISYKGNTLQVRISRQPEKLKMNGLKIALDAGHGGSNTGAQGVTTKILEKEYTLKIAKEVEKYLRKKGAQVFMVRNDDVDISMIDRAMILREAEPHVLISVHLNSSGNEKAKGVSTYYRYIGFRSLSQYILDRMLQLQLNNFGNIGAFNFSLSGPTEYPNCLLEVAFLSNREDEQRILNEKFHRDIAKQVYKGIRDWLKSLK